MRADNEFDWRVHAKWTVLIAFGSALATELAKKLIERVLPEKRGQ